MLMGPNGIHGNYRPCPDRPFVGKVFTNDCPLGWRCGWKCIKTTLPTTGRTVSNEWQISMGSCPAKCPVGLGRRGRWQVIVGLFRQILIGLGQNIQQFFHDRKIGPLYGRLQCLFHTVVAGNNRRVVGVHEPAGCLPGIGLPF